MPVLITGMHRSGTSMIARLLNLCGLYLGRVDEMIDPRPDNPRGFWEHYCFMMVSEYIIKKYGYHELIEGEVPILLRDDWQYDEGLKTSYLWAKRLAHSMENSTDGVWGFKDCRASLLLPFWYEIVPDLKVVICLRHPLDVAASLIARGDGVAEEHAVWSWYTYNRVLLDTAKDYQIRSYDEFFTQPWDWTGLQSMCDYCGLEPRVEALGEVIPSLRHRRTRDSTRLPQKVRELYEEMRNV